MWPPGERVVCKETRAVGPVVRRPATLDQSPASPAASKITSRLPSLRTLCGQANRVKIRRVYGSPDSSPLRPVQGRARGLPDETTVSVSLAQQARETRRASRSSNSYVPPEHPAATHRSIWRGCARRPCCASRTSSAARGHGDPTRDAWIVDHRPLMRAASAHGIGEPSRYVTRWPPIRSISVFTGIEPQEPVVEAEDLSPPVAIDVSRPWPEASKRCRQGLLPCKAL